MALENTQRSFTGAFRIFLRNASPASPIGNTYAFSLRKHRELLLQTENVLLIRLNGIFILIFRLFHFFSENSFHECSLINLFYTVIFFPDGLSKSLISSQCELAPAQKLFVLFFALHLIVDSKTIKVDSCHEINNIVFFQNYSIVKAGSSSQIFFLSNALP